MAHRHGFAALAIFAALVVVCPDADARGGGAAPGLANVGPPVWRAGPGPQRFVRPGVVQRRGAWQQFRFASPYYAWPFGGLWWGAGMSEAPAPFADPQEITAAIAREVAQQVARQAMLRPSCRLTTHTREVPSETGGTRIVTVTRCVAPEALAPWRNQADAPEDSADITGGVRSDTFARCRVETRSVPSDAGGTREIGIRRC